jgi:hypothetical protein
MQQVIDRVPEWEAFTNLDNWSLDEILDKLVFDRPIQHQEVAYIGFARSLYVEPRWTVSSLGTLQRIPQEIIDRIVSEMDFATISKFGRVSTATRYSVQNCRTFVELLKFAPYLPGVLRATQTLTYHSIKDAWCEMKTDKCHSCGGTGTCLFLPTCERVCQPCLRLNPAFWTCPRGVAAVAFGLTQEQVMQVPTICTLAVVNGIFHTQAPFTQEEPRHRLVPARRSIQVSIQLALKHAIKIYRSLEEVKRVAEQGEVIHHDATETDHDKLDWFSFLRSVPLGPINRSPALLNSPPISVPADWASTAPFFPPCKINENSAGRLHPGIVSIDFPYVSLSRERLQRSYLCNGCHEMFNDNRFMRLHSSRYLDEITPLGLHGIKREEFLGREFFRRALTFRTWEDTRKHLRDCPGTKWVMCCRRLNKESRVMERDCELGPRRLTNVYKLLITESY